MNTLNVCNYSEAQIKSIKKAISKTKPKPKRDLSTTITQTRLKSLLDYNPETGIFTWKVSKGPNVVSGQIAGTKHSAGYIKIKVDKTIYCAHQLAWLYQYGTFPNKIFFVDGNRSNIKLCNLQNRSLCKNNKSGFKNIYWNKPYNKWQVLLYKNGNTHFIGNYNTIEDAIKARDSASANLGLTNLLV